MESQQKKTWYLTKLKQILFFLWLFFLFAKLIGMFVNGGKEFFRKEYMVILQNILLGLILVLGVFEIIYSLIYDKENTIKKIKEIWPRKRIIDFLLPIIFGVLFFAVCYYSRRN